MDGDKIQSKLILPLSIAIQVNNKEAYDLLINKVSEIEDFNDENGYFSIAIKYNNEYALSDLLKNHKNKLKVSIDDFMMSNFLHLNENILKLLVKFGGKEKFLETKLIEIARKYSEYLKLLNNKDTTIDQYKECFYQSKEFTKELKKACQDDFNLNQIQQKIFSQDGKELISEIIKETRQSQCEFNFYQIMKQIFIHQRKLISEIIKETPQTDHKDLVKWLTLFGVKFSFHNLDKILLSSQPSMNESKNYPKDLDGAFINLKKMSKVKIKDGKLYNDHTGDIINGSEDQELLYVVDKKGQLYINVNKYDAPVHHSFILNGYNKKHTLEGISMFGYGKPAACGGHLKIKDGIITKINNDSGHYAPNQDMLTQVCHELLNEKVLDPNFLLTDYTNKPISLSNLNVEEVIVTGEYLFLDY